MEVKEERKFAAECSAENAAQVAGWFANRGGVRVWKSVDLRDAGATCMTQALTTTGEPTTKPGWKYGK